MINSIHTPKYCIYCGADIEVVFHDSKYRYKCPKCNWTLYEQLKVSSAAQIILNDKLLLIKRAYNPWANYWYLPAGYVESDESPSEAVIREVYEETRLSIKVNKLNDLYYFNDDPRGNGILLVYDCTICKGNATVTEEAKEIGYFCPSEIPPSLAGAGHAHAIQKWKKTNLL